VYLRRRPYQSDAPIESPVFSIDEQGAESIEIVGWPSLAEHLGLSVGSCRTSISLGKGVWHRHKNGRGFIITKLGTKLISPPAEPADPNYHAPTGLRRYGVSDQA